ncbi:hypothetical protein ARALYDRAFT_911668 [Arabidopsis lyrata subsp. lyrata]|uniref:Uncharacterized protein n=1 Tax=Arabidopsis lyrata subsp. lyrata TaxID=81972 RepID=D7M140_ARALL|nr:hypothetical protein ARALYDRAFT_911668 [Arabidopsis lyrata subsp. lyrata]
MLCQVKQFRGKQVRKQAAVTPTCMQALVQDQSRVRAYRRAPLDSIELKDYAKQTKGLRDLSIDGSTIGGKRMGEVDKKHFLKVCK